MAMLMLDLVGKISDLKNLGFWYSVFCIGLLLAMKK